MSFSSLQTVNNGFHTDGSSGVVFNPDGTITGPTTNDPMELLQNEDTGDNSSTNVAPKASTSTVKSTAVKSVTQPEPVIKATSYTWLWITGGATVAIISGFLLYLKFKKK